MELSIVFPGSWTGSREQVKSPDPSFYGAPPGNLLVFWFFSLVYFVEFFLIFPREPLVDSLPFSVPPSVCVDTVFP